jgi:hypothetical protein
MSGTGGGHRYQWRCSRVFNNRWESGRHGRFEDQGKFAGRKKGDRVFNSATKLGIFLPRNTPNTRKRGCFRSISTVLTKNLNGKVNEVSGYENFAYFAYFAVQSKRS